MKKYMLYFIVQGLICGAAIDKAYQAGEMHKTVENILEKSLVELTDYKV